ncbi:YcjF family protein [Paraglaciecola aquimarina]|uniref:YcjF family protein n=1 Tax=Paraglaciecola algarum TaxID=3050085 RepID=A0ABS9D2Q1_9ALTE|nr:TIGR01620 family protein [Paraglaciecola sp. G1-23]MCF2946879.1 YcjF family protein [Paraglaciecola sp. G1-23]
MTKPVINSAEDDDKNNEELQLKSAKFLSQNLEEDTETYIKPRIQNMEFTSADTEHTPEISQNIELAEPELDLPKKSNRKWFLILAIVVLLASTVELALFVVTMVQQSDWLAGIWLTIFIGFSLFIIRLVWQEFRGLKRLKQQMHSRDASQQIYNSTAIGLAEEHCLNMAKGLPQRYQKLVTNWHVKLEANYTDNEVLCLYEQQVLVPIDKLAIKTVTQNASAAGVMIAASPFALLDMLIVFWRNIRMINQVSQIYGVNLGYWGRIQLIKNIFSNMIYAGAAEILSEAGNYALGAGITGKLSSSLAQGLGASVLTTRVGLKAIAENRPMPCLSVAKPSLNVITKQLFTDLKNKIS